MRAVPDEPAWQVYFSPNHGATKAVVDALDAAKATVLVQAYSFTSAPIAKALVEAHDRGVDIARRSVSNDVTDHRLLPAVTHLTRPFNAQATESHAKERVPQEWKLLSQRPSQTHCTETSSPHADFAIRSAFLLSRVIVHRTRPRKVGHYGPCGSKPTLNAFAIVFEGRITPARNN